MNKKYPAQLNFRVNDFQLSILEQLERDSGYSRSELIRRLIELAGFQDPESLRAFLSEKIKEQRLQDTLSSFLDAVQDRYTGEIL